MSPSMIRFPSVASLISSILTPGALSKRLSGSLAFAMHAYKNGIQIIRTHDVFETKQAIICQETMN